MNISSGTRLGPYEIVALLGAGGMGEVYRARDVRLGRDVALKLLTRTTLADEAMRRRFDIEARAASALSHPNLLTLYDVGEHQGAPFLVSELLEGETLREALRRGPLGTPRAISIAAQLARGLAAAHEHGIVHRDLKPENIFLTSDGRTKILDFGLAKLALAPVIGGDLATAATVDATTPGTLLGTVGYMSPEQVRGEPVDARGDLFAFGAVLYEMLTGERAFARATAVETMTAILRDPPPRDRDHAVPSELARLIDRCLEKSPESRLQGAQELAVALERLIEPRAAVARRGQRPLALAAVLAALAAAAALAYAIWRPGAPPAGASPVPKLAQLTSAEGTEEAPAWSSDGRRLVYCAAEQGLRNLVLRELADGSERRLTDGAHDDLQPAFSADGGTVFFVRSRVAGKRLEPGDIFGQYGDGDLWALDLGSGNLTRVAELAFNPAVSPDGREIAVDASWAGGRRIWLLDTNGTNPRQLTSDVSEAVDHLRPRWSPDGRRVVFHVVERTKFDLRSVEVESRRITALTDDHFLDVDPVYSPKGDFVYFTSDRGGGLNLWRLPLDRQGGAAGRPQQRTTGAGRDLDLAFAPSGAAVFTILGQNADLWQLPIDTATHTVAGTPQSLIASTREDSRGAYSPDGQRVAFNSDRGGVMNLWLWEGTDAAPRQLTRGEGGDYQPTWFPDGRTLVFFSARAGSPDIWRLDVDSGVLRQLTSDSGMEINPFVSPDGGRIAYHSDHSGRLELWVMNADGGEPRQLTTLGVFGHFLRWIADGEALLFRCPCSGRNALYRVSSRGGEPQELPPVKGGSHLSLSPDGRFLLDVVGHQTLWISPLAGGEPVKLFEFEDPSDRIDYPMWSPDGTRALFDRFRPSGGDLWSATDL